MVNESGMTSPLNYAASLTVAYTHTTLKIRWLAIEFCSVLGNERHIREIKKLSSYYFSLFQIPE